MKYQVIFFGLLLLLLLSACQKPPQDCYQIVEIDRVEHNVKELTLDQSSKDATISKSTTISEDKVDKHYVGKDFSVYIDGRAYEVIDLKSERRFVKYHDKENPFEEKERYSRRLEMSAMTLPVKTGLTKNINGIECDEYILKSNHRLSVFYYINPLEKFVYKYRNPFSFPGMVVRSPLYKGRSYVEELTFEKRACDCPQEYYDLVKEVQSIMQ